MMQRNKIIDKLFKKLLKAQFSHAQINDFLKLEYEFSKFEYFIYYLFSLSLKTFVDQKCIMAKSINEYLEYLVSTNQIESLSIDRIKPYQNFSTYEISLLGAKGFDSIHPFTFDIDENCYIALNEHPFNEYKNIINVAFCYSNQTFLNSAINQRILNNRFNQILVFKKMEINYEYLGIYKIKSISQIYQNENAFPSLILVKADHDDEDSLLEYQNLNKRNFLVSFNTLKNNVKNLIILNRNDTYRFLNIIETNSCHYLLLYNLIQHVLTINDYLLLCEIKMRFRLMLKQQLMLPIIIPEQVTIDEYYLTLFANNYDVLYGMQINTDFLHNIYLVINQENIQKNGDEISVRFVKSYANYFFDLEINKKIFNTVIDNTCIYLFIKDESKLMYQGLYKTTKLKIGADLQNKLTPIFILRPLNLYEVQKHLMYINQTITTNQYKNAFINFMQNNDICQNWIKDKTLISPIKTNHENDLYNSILYKFNWIINKCLQSSDAAKYQKYSSLFFKLNGNHLLNVANCLSYKYSYIINQKLMQPWTIAYQMTKQNFSNKLLFNMAYIDFYETKEKIYKYCLAVIKN